MSELWVFVGDLAADGPYALSADESRHVTSRRLRVGDPLVLFDGRGRSANARIESTSKRSVEVVAEEISREPAPTDVCLIASAIPKGDRLSTMLQMLTQLGVESWQPLVLDESVVRKFDPESPRTQRILVESAKLARRPWLLEVAEPCPLDALLVERAGAGSIFFGDREAEAAGLEASARLVVIGPEAGFSRAEWARLREAGAEPRSLAPHNLRIETAAIAAAGALHVARANAAKQAACVAPDAR